MVSKYIAQGSGKTIFICTTKMAFDHNSTIDITAVLAETIRSLEEYYQYQLH
jgi:aminopeptidase-like protein